MVKDYDVYLKKIKSTLDSVSKVAFTLDGWTSPYQDSFLAVTAHFMDSQWQLRDVTLGFEPLKGKHTGECLMKTFIDVLRRFGLQRKILSVTSDNGSNIIRMTKDLAKFTKDNPEEW